MHKGARKVKDLLCTIYGEEKGGKAFDRIYPLVEAFPRQPPKKSAYFSENDVS